MQRIKFNFLKIDQHLQASLTVTFGRSNWTKKGVAFRSSRKCDCFCKWVVQAQGSKTEKQNRNR